MPKQPRIGPRFRLLSFVWIYLLVIATFAIVGLAISSLERDLKIVGVRDSIAYFLVFVSAFAWLTSADFLIAERKVDEPRFEEAVRVQANYLGAVFATAAAVFFLLPRFDL